MEYDDYNSGAPDIQDDFSYSYCLRIHEYDEFTTLSFLFGERKALLSIDSNWLFQTYDWILFIYALTNTNVDGAFEQQTPGVGKVSGTMQVGDLQFQNMVFVPGICKTIILGQLDKEGCSTVVYSFKWEISCIYGSDGGFLFTAVQKHNQWFCIHMWYKSAIAQN